MMMIPPPTQCFLQTVNYSAALLFLLLANISGFVFFLFCFTYMLKRLNFFFVLFCFVLIGWQKKSVDCQPAPFQIATTGSE